MNRLLSQMNRPVVWASLYFICGIIGGRQLSQSKLFPLFFLSSFCLVFLILWCQKSRRWTYCVCVLFFVLGGIRYLYHPISYEANQLSQMSVVQVSGLVEEVAAYDYGCSAVMGKVRTPYGKMQTKILLRILGNQEIKEGDRVTCMGRWQAFEPPLNPSDYDYGEYIRSQNVCGEIVVTQIEVEEAEKKGSQLLRQSLEERINQLFYPGDEGIINLLVIGEPKLINEKVQDAYYSLGIGHILSISGFHIGVIIVGAWAVLGMSRVPYSIRYGGVLSIVWGYALLVGCGISTVRACLIATIIGVGRCLWQEEDLATALAISAGIILMGNPYCLFQVGFQLSFGAMVGVILSGLLIEELRLKYTLSKGLLQIMSSCVIALIIFPIMAYHFFNVSVIGVLLNLICIPLFGMILPASFCIIGISFIHFGLAHQMATLLTFVLDGFNHIVLWIAKMPFAVWVIGRPQMGTLILYYVTVGILFLCALDLIKQERSWRDFKRVGFLVVILGVWLTWLVEIRQEASQLEITQLYVGQGDASVLELPTGQVVLVDGGKTGKGETIQRFLNYKGKSKIACVVLSHPHEDHIGGVLDLIEREVPIGGIVVGILQVGEETDIFVEQLFRKCSEKNIPIYTVTDTRELVIGHVVLQLQAESISGNSNESSLVCQVKFGDYTQLFVGDIGFEREKMLPNLGDIDVLKVAHHGSKYATGQDFLLQTKPEYGIISSGRNNRYNHPHQDAIERMQRHGVTLYGTQDMGAIRIVTDGEAFKISNQLQKEPMIYEGD
ncbi:MAG: DNA internalization-related competence protein ComEC/Rec2 [Cellulosilyticaceae bacterium]